MSNQYRVSVYNDNTKGYFGSYDVSADDSDSAVSEATDKFLEENPKFQKRYLRVVAQEISTPQTSNNVVAESGE